MNSVRLQIFSANAFSRYRNDLDASAAKPRNDRRKLGLLVSLAQPPGIECATYRAKKVQIWAPSCSALGRPGPKAAPVASMFEQKY